MLLAFTTLTGWAQEIKMNEPSISDYLPLLKAKGYIAYSFDTKDFKDAMAEPVVMESSEIVKSIPHFYVFGIKIR